MIIIFEYTLLMALCGSQTINIHNTQLNESSTPGRFWWQTWIISQKFFFATSRVRPRNCLWFYCILLIETLTSFSRPENLLFFLINGWQIICSKLVLFTVWEEVRRAKIAWEFPDVRIRHISSNWFEKQKFLLNLYRLRGENRND